MKRQIRLELELGGKIRPLLFDFEFVDHLETLTPLAKLDEMKAWRVIPIVALAAMRSGADFEGKKLEKSIDLKIATQWVLEMEGEEANQIFEAYKSAMGFIVKALGIKPVASPDPSTGTDS